MEIFKKINKASAGSELEKKHVPIIDCPASVKAGEAFNVTISWGKEVPHPDEGGHFIQWVELYWKDVEIARAEFSPTITAGPVTFTVKLTESVSLMARLRCNLHGIWESEKNVSVS
jgi:superoxide reductase